MNIPIVMVGVAFLLIIVLIILMTILSSRAGESPQEQYDAGDDAKRIKDQIEQQIDEPPKTTKKKKGK